MISDGIQFAAIHKTFTPQNIIPHWQMLKCTCTWSHLHVSNINSMAAEINDYDYDLPGGSTDQRFHVLPNGFGHLLALGK